MTTDVITLHDDATGSLAEVLPRLGLNCYRFRAMLGDQAIEVLWSEDGFESGGRRPSGSGIPVLFPFPGRIRGTSLSYQGRDYPLGQDDGRGGDGQGNAIHGFVLDRPWRVVDQSSTHVTGEFHAAADDPSLLERWPADFRIRVTYRLSGNALSIETLIDNPGDGDLPFGFGLHPYFCVPLGGDSAGVCRVTAPVHEVWELDGMVATGRKLSLNEESAKGKDKLAGGMPFSATALDDVFTGLDFIERQCTATITDPGSGATLSMTFDDGFRECVIYNPPHRRAICLEPYTSVPGPFELEAQGVDTGLRRLKPGESFRCLVTICLTPFEK